MHYYTCISPQIREQYAMLGSLHKTTVLNKIIWWILPFKWTWYNILGKNQLLIGVFPRSRSIDNRVVFAWAIS